MSQRDDSYTLHNLVVSVQGDPGTFVCSHKPGPAFSVEGENLIFDQGQNRFSLYSLAALLPLIPAKERQTHKNDWMTTDQDIACPDPYCGARFRIERVSEIVQKHSEVTKVPLPEER